MSEQPSHQVETVTTTQGLVNQTWEVRSPVPERSGDDDVVPPDNSEGSLTLEQFDNESALSVGKSTQQTTSTRAFTNP
jgi:hypothetical protein